MPPPYPAMLLETELPPDTLMLLPVSPWMPPPDLAAVLLETMLFPNTLVVLPAATAHSRPDENIEPDADPDIPRWFCRATLRVAIAGKPRGKAAKRAAKKEFEADRLALALLVAETVWGDPVFATAARSCDPATPYPVSSPSLL